MWRTDRLKAASLGFVVLVLFCAAGAAHGEDNNYSLIRILNDTDQVVTYSFQWGDGKWREVTLQPNMEHTHWWRYAKPNQNWSPSKTIVYDNFVGKSVKQHLEAYAVPTRWDEGKRYHFGFDGKRLVLYNDN